MSDTGTTTGLRVYESLAERLRLSLRKGNFAPGQLLGSEHELARRESISRMTVRRASELLINEGLLERRPGKGLYVRAVMNGEGKPAAPRHGAGVVQVIVGNMLWEPALQMSRGMQAAAKDKGVHVQLYDAHGDIDLDVSMVEQLPAGQARGAVIVSLSSPRFSQAIYKLHLEGYPFVLLDQQMRDIEVSAVTSDNHAGGYMAGKHLLANGHTRIAFIGDLIAASVQARLLGLRDAIGDACIPFRRDRVVDLIAGADRFGDWTGCVSEGVRRLMDQPERPTAIFCSCDGVARLVYRALAAMNVSVPDDVSVIGYDDDPLAEWLSPTLTTVRQPFLQMGQEAMEMLDRRIADPSAPAEFRRLPVELVERGSVKSLTNPRASVNVL